MQHAVSPVLCSADNSSTAGSRNALVVRRNLLPATCRACQKRKACSRRRVLFEQFDGPVAPNAEGQQEWVVNSPPGDGLRCKPRLPESKDKRLVTKEIHDNTRNQRQHQDTAGSAETPCGRATRAYMLRKIANP